MASSKAHCFDPLLYQQSIWFKALAHPARIKIIELLLENGTLPFPQIQKPIPLALETVSQHLRALRKQGIIHMQEIYPHSYYSLDAELCRYLIDKSNSFYRKFDDAVISLRVNE